MTSPSRASEETVPLFLHDCPTCTFMGHFASGELVGDGYYCDHRTLPEYRGSIVWRLSDEGSEYHSFPVESIEGMRNRRLAGEPGYEGSVFEDILTLWEKQHGSALVGPERHGDA